MANPFQKLKERVGMAHQKTDEHMDLMNGGPSSADPRGRPQGDMSANLPTTEPRLDGSTTNPPAANRGGALSLLSSNPFKGIERYGMPFLQTITHYIFMDPFTTLLNAPTSRFMAVFFAVYMTLYFFFAIVYMFFPGYCMNSPSRMFSHGFWFSFQTASTIGYSDPNMYPNPDCNLFNFVVMIEIILASLLDYCLMGVVFARFAAPLPKAQAIRFSSNAVLYQPEPLSNWVLSFRLANIRKHSLLKPEICLLLAMPEAENASLRFKALQIHDMTTQEANLRLGLPATVLHVVDSSSPLFDLSLDMMETKAMEIICFMDGMDPMTSNSVQARNSYRPSDIRMNEHFTTIGLQANWRGRVGLDFTHFDTTVAAAGLPLSSSRGNNLGTDEYLYPTAADTSSIDALNEHMLQLRARTFRAITSDQAGGDSSELQPGGLPLPLLATARGHTSTWGGAGAGRSDPLGVLDRRQGVPPSVSQLIDAVLEDPSMPSVLKRHAALARAELLSSELLPQLPVSVPLQSVISSEGGGGGGGGSLYASGPYSSGMPVSVLASTAYSGGEPAAPGLRKVTQAERLMYSQ